jgi:hypothetical protein
MKRHGRAFEEGVKLFNEGRFWEAHEAWEQLWKDIPEDSPPRIFIQGFIQVAAAIDKYMKKEYAGTEKLLPKGMSKITGLMDLGKEILDMEDFLRQLGSFRERFESQREGIPEGGLPRITLLRRENEE